MRSVSYFRRIARSEFGAGALRPHATYSRVEPGSTIGSTPAATSQVALDPASPRKRRASPRTATVQSEPISPAAPPLPPATNLDAPRNRTRESRFLEPLRPTVPPLALAAPERANRVASNTEVTLGEAGPPTKEEAAPRIQSANPAAASRDAGLPSEPARPIYKSLPPADPPSKPVRSSKAYARPERSIERGAVDVPIQRPVPPPPPAFLRGVPRPALSRGFSSTDPPSRPVPASNAQARPEPSVQIGTVEVHIQRPAPSPPQVILRRLPSVRKPPLSRGFSTWGLRQG
jgi:hypothetical protein